MTIKKAMTVARSMVIENIRGIGTMGLKTASGKTYSILNSETLIDAMGNEIAVEEVTEEIESVTSTCDQLGGIYI